MRLSQDLPIVIEVIENAERIEKMLPELDQMIGGGLVTLEKAGPPVVSPPRKTSPRHLLYCLNACVSLSE